MTILERFILLERMNRTKNENIPDKVNNKCNTP